jgi:FdhD protein
MMKSHTNQDIESLLPMTRRFLIERFRDGSLQTTQDELSVEEPLQVVLNGKPFATLMRSPGEDVALVEGFLFAEGLVARPEDIVSIAVSAHPTSQEVHVTLEAHCNPAGAMARSVYLSSSCGVCGRATIDELLERVEPVAAMPVQPDFLIGLLDPFAAAQREFGRTGGVHAAALFDGAGNLLEMCEDVGRHNALDKLVGRAFRRGQLPLAGRILLMSSRASFDIVQKAAMAGIPVVATMGAASSLAAEVAAATGIGLYAFLRPQSVVRILPLR